MQSDKSCWTTKAVRQSGLWRGMRYPALRSKGPVPQGMAGDRETANVHPIPPWHTPDTSPGSICFENACLGCTVQGANELDCPKEVSGMRHESASNRSWTMSRPLVTRLPIVLAALSQRHQEGLGRDVLSCICDTGEIRMYRTAPGYPPSPPPFLIDRD